MGLQLIESGFQPSTLPGAVIFTCKWEYAAGSGAPIVCYSSALVEPDAILTVNFWNDMISHMGHWYAARKRKQGECCALVGAHREQPQG